MRMRNSGKVRGCQGFGAEREIDKRGDIHAEEEMEMLDKPQLQDRKLRS